MFEWAITIDIFNIIVIKFLDDAFICPVGGLCYWCVAVVSLRGVEPAIEGRQEVNVEHKDER